MTMVPSMGNGVHHAAHGFGRNLVGVFAVALAHGLGRGNRRFFHHAQKLHREIGFRFAGLRVFMWRSVSTLVAIGLRGHETVTRSAMQNRFRDDELTEVRTACGQSYCEPRGNRRDNPRSVATLTVLQNAAMPGDVLANDQRMNVMRAFIGLHRLQVHHVAEDWILVGDTVAAQNVAAHARALQRHPDVVPLGHRDVLRA